MRYNNSYKTMWHVRHTQLCEMSYEKYNDELGEIDVLVAIIINEAQLNNKEFFNSLSFYSICKCLRLDYDVIKRVMLHTMNVVENKIPWNHHEEAVRIRAFLCEEEE